MTLTSPTNANVKAAAALHQRKYRDREGRFLAEGPGPVLEALRDGVVEALFATEDGATHLPAGIECTLVSDDVMGKLSDAVTPQGLVAVCRRDVAPLEAVIGHGFAVVLHAIADPGNAGGIVRTADAAGASGVVFTTGSVDPWNPKAVRAAAGSVTHLPLVVGASIDDVLAACHGTGTRTVALDTRGDRDIDDPALFAPPSALVLGNEAHGLPEGVRAMVDAVAQIPRFGRAESLNLAAATAVAAYAAARVVHPAVSGDHGPDPGAEQR